VATNVKQKLAARSAQKKRLSSVLFELTYRCNLDCFFCYNDLDLKGKPLTREQYFQALEDLAAMNVLTVSLSGGEPLAHPDFFPIGTRAKDLGFLVRVKSNGHALRGSVAKRVKEEVDPYIVEVSIHGASAEVHDRQTRVPGSFDRLKANLQDMKEAGLRVQLNSPMTKWNEHEFDGVIEMAKDLEFKLNIDPAITPRDNGDASPLSIQPSRDAVQRLLHLHHGDELVVTEPEAGSEPRQATGPNCGAGLVVASVDPFGSVFPCVQWRVPVGNLHQQRFSEIWREDSERLSRVRDINYDVGAEIASLGEASAGVGACMGISKVELGDAEKLHSTAQVRLEILTGEPKVKERLPVVR